MDFQAIQLMFSQAAKEKGRVDWRLSDAYVVSSAYVSDFVKNSSRAARLQGTDTSSFAQRKPQLRTPSARAWEPSIARSLRPDGTTYGSAEDFPDDHFLLAHTEQCDL